MTTSTQFISLYILITCLQDNVKMLWEEVLCWSLLGVKGLKAFLFFLISDQFMV